MAAAEPSTSARWSVAGAAIALLATAAMGALIMAFWSNLFSHGVDSSVSHDIDVESLALRREDNLFAAARERMVDRQLRRRDIRDPKVLRAMGHVARDRFVPSDMQGEAYADRPLPIGFGQTISQPYIVALMTQLARPTAKSRALEIGVGSGYQTAILAELCEKVYGVEILQPLADNARARLASLGYGNIAIRCGDGYQGWAEHAPFDLILVTAAPDHVPQPLLEQLAPGGRLVIPVGRGYQELLLIEKRADGSLHRESAAPVQFVPMTGEAELRGGL